MAGFSFKPTREDKEAFERRLQEARVWWVRLDPMVERLFCEKRYTACMWEVTENGMRWAGIGVPHHCRRRATDREDVDLLEFGAPLEVLAVEHARMEGLMHVLRANGCHGRYREAGTEREYEF